MSSQRNQTIERHYFEQFRSHYELPAGEIVFTDRPDVIVRGAKSIGIEIANLYLASGADPASEQAQRPRRLQILERAQELHRSSGGRRIELSVGFSPEHPICELDPIARALAAIATMIENDPSGPVIPARFGHVPELHYVYHNQNEYADAKWRHVPGYSVPLLSFERLRAQILDKTGKLRNYQLCDAYWLLLVVDFMDSAQDQDLQWPPGEVFTTTPFERILLYKSQFGEVLQVPQ